MSKTSELIKDHVIGFIVSGVLLLALLYAVTMSWRSDQKLAAQSEQLDAIRNDLAEVKKSFIAFLLDPETKKSDIVKGLVSDANTLKGIDQFRAGQFSDAYEVWLSSAERGSRESAYAIAAANATLTAHANDAELPSDERKKVREALALAPTVEFRNGAFLVKETSR